MSFFESLQGGAAVVLQVALIQTLLRRGLPRHLLLFAYIVSLFLATIMEFSIRLRWGDSDWSNTVIRYYWSAALIHQLLVFATIIGYIRQRMEKTHRGSVSRWLIPGATATVLLSLAVEYAPKLNRWMTAVTRDLSFAAILLNFMLWTVLLRDRQRNPRLLAISSGLGIQLAGQAMGQGLRMLGENGRLFINAGNYLMVLSYLLSLYVLARAFRHEEAATPNPEPAPSLR